MKKLKVVESLAWNELGIIDVKNMVHTFVSTDWKKEFVGQYSDRKEDLSAYFGPIERLFLLLLRRLARDNRSVLTPFLVP